MTPIVFIYKCMHRVYSIMMHACHTFATWIKFKNSEVKFSSFESNGIPKVWANRRNGYINIGEDFHMNNGNVANIIGFGVPCALMAENATISIGDHVGMSQTTLYALGADITIGNHTLMGGGQKYIQATSILLITIIEEMEILTTNIEGVRL